MNEMNRTSIHNCQVAESQIKELDAQVSALTEQRNAVITAVLGDEWILAKSELSDSSTLHKIIRDQIEAEKAEAQSKMRSKMNRQREVLVLTDKALSDAQAEITRLRAGGCARDQHTTQYCGEMGRLVTNLTALADEWREETWDEGQINFAAPVAEAFIRAYLESE